MERLIQLTSRLPPSSKLREKLTIAQVDGLWSNLQHPPLSYCGAEYMYRQPDGSHNNVMDPNLGKAGSPYARSVKPMTRMPGAPPDAATLFDALYSRGKNGENYRPNANNISSMLFYTASIVIHGSWPVSSRNNQIAYIEKQIYSAQTAKTPISPIPHHISTFPHSTVTMWHSRPACVRSRMECSSLIRFRRSACWASHRVYPFS